jgi:hypothetical protein
MARTDYIEIYQPVGLRELADIIAGITCCGVSADGHHLSILGPNWLISLADTDPAIKMGAESDTQIYVYASDCAVQHEVSQKLFDRLCEITAWPLHLSSDDDAGLPPQFRISRTRLDELKAEVYTWPENLRSGIEDEIAWLDSIVPSDEDRVS